MQSPQPLFRSKRHNGVTVFFNPRLCAEMVKIQDGQQEMLVVHCAIPDSCRIPLAHIRAWKMTPPEIIFSHSVVWSIASDFPAEHRFYFPKTIFQRKGQEQRYLDIAYCDVGKIINDDGDVLWEKTPHSRIRAVRQ